MSTGDRMKIAISLLIVMASISLPSCGTTPASSTAAITTSILPGTSNRVEVTLFYSPDDCDCMKNGKIWVETTINTDYQSQLEKGILVFRVYDADDPSSAALKQQFGVSGLSLYFSDVRGTVVTTREFKSVWLYLDTSLKAQFISVLKKEIDKHLVGL